MLNALIIDHHHRLFYALIPIVLIMMNSIPMISPHSFDADMKTCETMLPSRSNATAQTSASRFVIQVDGTASPGSRWRITLSSVNSSTKFSGFLIQVRKPGGNTAEGTFDDKADDVGSGTAKTMDCFGIVKSSVTHASDADKTSVTVQWNSPSMQEYQVYYTVVKDELTFWARVAHTQKIDTPTKAQPPSKLVDKWRDLYRNCGDRRTKGCFGLPESCIQDFDPKVKVPKTCDMMVTWMKGNGSSLQFELTGRSGSKDGSGYVAVGFSDDMNMGEDSVAACTLKRGDKKPPLIERYFNVKDKQDNVKHSDATLGLKGISSSLIDGNLFCNFIQTNHKINGFSVNFKKKYYFMLSRAPSFSDLKLGQHPTTDDRGVSENPVLFSDFSRPGLTHNRWLVHLHGALMLFAWCVFSTSGSFTARYYRQTCIHEACVGKPFWLTVHVTCMIINAIFTLSAIGSMIAYKRGIKISSHVHVILGWVVIALGIPQGIFPLFRDSSWAPSLVVFRWSHFFVGQVLQIVAYTCIIFVLDLDLAQLRNSSSLWTGGVVSVIIFQIFMHIVMTYHTYWADGKLEVAPEYRYRALIPGPLGRNGTLTEAPGKRFRYMMLMVYIVGVITLLSALLTCMVLHIV